MFHIPSRNCIPSRDCPSHSDIRESIAIDCERRSHCSVLRIQRNVRCTVALRHFRPASLELVPMSTARRYDHYAMHNCKRCSDRTIILAMLRIVARMSQPIPSLDCAHNRFHRHTKANIRPKVWCVPVDIAVLRVFDCV